MIQKNTIHNIFTLAAEFTKTILHKNSFLLTCRQESERLVRSQIEGQTNSGSLRESRRRYFHCGVNSFRLIFK